MYTAFYGLREKPFNLTPDPRFLFLAESHREALAHLLYGIDQEEGFIAVTGEVGTGKTTLCRTLLERLGSDTVVAFLFNPSRSATELLQDIAAEFGIQAGASTRREISDQLNRFLMEQKREGRRVLLIIDEAQNLSSGTLEQIRLLSNLETPTSKLIQILLLGQPELDVKLDSPGLRQLRQRISVRWGLSALSRRETGAYVHHRLRVAAGARRRIFSESAVREVHRRTGGIPRLINVLCDRTLLAGYSLELRRVDASVVRQAAREIPDARRPVVRVARAGAARWRRGLAAALGLGLFGSALFAGLHFDELRRWARPGQTAPASSTDEQSLPSVATSPASPGPAPAARTAEPVAAADLPGVAAATPVALELPSTEPEPTLGQLLSGVDPDAGFGLALEPLLASFEVPPAATPPGNLEDLLEVIESRGLAPLPVSQANAESLRALNHPALLLLRGEAGDEHWVSLLRLGDDEATLHGATARGALRLPLEEVERQWQGEAFIVWRDFEETPVLTPNSDGDGIVWLQGALSELGLYAGRPSGTYDEVTLNGVIALQAARRLTPDGVVGPRTKMVIYDMLGHYSIPRLVQREGSG